MSPKKKVYTYEEVAGSVIRTNRVAKGLPAEVMAKKLQITKSALSRVETRGSGLTVARIRLAARALGVQPWILMKAIDETVVKLEDEGCEVAS